MFLEQLFHSQCDTCIFYSQIGFGTCSQIKVVRGDASRDTDLGSKFTKVPTSKYNVTCGLISKYKFTRVPIGKCGLISKSKFTRVPTGKCGFIS